MEFISLSEIVEALAETAEAHDTNCVRIPIAARISRAAAALHSLLVHNPPNSSIPRPKMVDRGREDGQIFLDDSAAEEAIGTLQYWGTWTQRVKKMRADLELKSGGAVAVSDTQLYDAIRVEDDKFINDTFIRLTEIGFDRKLIADYLKPAGVFLEVRPLDAAVARTAQVIRDRTPAPLYCEGFSDELRSLSRLSKFLDYDTWSPRWASMLVCGIEPPSKCDDWPSEATSLAGTFLRGDSLHFAEAKRVLALWNSRIDPPQKVTPSDFVSWCESKGIDTDWLRSIRRSSETAIAPALGSALTPTTATDPSQTRTNVLDTQYLATSSSLIEAFHPYGVTKTKVERITSYKWLRSARKLQGIGGNGRAQEPMFCPKEVMQSLIKMKKIGEKRGWDILEKKFPIAFEKFQDEDPREFLES